MRNNTGKVFPNQKNLNKLSRDYGEAMQTKNIHRTNEIINNMADKYE